MKNKYSAEFKIDPYFIKFPLDDKLEKFMKFKRPVAFPLMVVKNKCKEMLSVGYDGSTNIMGYQTKSAPAEIHWMWPVSKQAFDSLVKCVNDFDEQFNKMFNENPVIHVAESAFVYEDDTHLLHKDINYNK